MYAESPGRRWRYVGVEAIAGRLAHHLECDGDVWIDVETRLMLKSRGLAVDEGFYPIPGVYRAVEATEVVFGQPPAELFALRAPDGVPTIDDATYSCATNPQCTASPEPVPTPSPALGPQDAPDDLGALVERSITATSEVEAFAATIEQQTHPYGGSTSVVIHDGAGNWRFEQQFPDAIPDYAIQLIGPDHHYRTNSTTDGVVYWEEGEPSLGPSATR